MGNVNRKTVPMLLALSLLGVGCSPSEPQIIDESKYEDLYDDEQTDSDDTDSSDDAEPNDDSDGFDDEGFPDPPELPDAVKDESEDGAIAAADYFLDAYEYAYHTAELSAFEEIFSADCTYCDSLRSTFTNQSENEHSAVDARFSERETIGTRVEDKDIYVVVDTSLKNFDLRDSEGEKLQAYQRIDYTFTLKVSYIDGAWKLLGADVERNDDVA